jgi:hypothetical protein
MPPRYPGGSGGTASPQNRNARHSLAVSGSYPAPSWLLASLALSGSCSAPSAPLTSMAFPVDSSLEGLPASSE